MRRLTSTGSRRRGHRSLLAGLLPVVSVLGAAVIADAAAETVSADETGTAQRSFGGPGSTASQLASDAELNAESCRKGLAARLRLYCDFKRSLHRESGTRFGVDYNALLQNAAGSPGEDHAAGGVIRLFGTWTLPEPGAPGEGYLVFKAENRHRLGTELAPQALGAEFGYAGLTALTFSDAGTLLTNLYWEQSLPGDRFAYVLGIVDVTDYVAVYGLANPWTDFSNLAFSTDATIDVPGQGLGTAVRWRLGTNFYMVAGLADANGDPSDPLDSFEAFLDTGELFKHVEVGRYGTWEGRIDDNVHVTLWQVDERTETGIGSGWGSAFSLSRTVNDRWLTFVRLGYGDGGGALLHRSFGTGFGYRASGNRGLLGLGLNWGRPNGDLFGSDARDQYTVEVYWRYQLGAHVSITPDIQVVKNPGLDPLEDLVWVAAVRARVFF